MDGLVELADDFDQIALVVDWLDACRNRDLTTLLDLYADDATLECRCGGVKVGKGRAALETYWRPRLEVLAPTAFELEEITPTTDRRRARLSKPRRQAGPHRIHLFARRQDPANRLRPRGAGVASGNRRRCGSGWLTATAFSNESLPRT